MKTLLSWSTGKDAAWALHVLRQDPDIDVRGLFSTVSEPEGRVAMHNVRREICEAQAAAVGLPLSLIPIPDPCPNVAYERALGRFVEQAVADGVEAFAFGDLYLEDIRAYRERTLEGSGIRPLFPLWRRPTMALAREMVAAGLRAYVVGVDTRQLDASFAGRVFDGAFLDDLPPGVDPCGEAGEFHTCVFAGPMFRYSLKLRLGPVRERGGFVLADLTLASESPESGGE